MPKQSLSHTDSLAKGETIGIRQTNHVGEERVENSQLVINSSSEAEIMIFAGIESRERGQAGKIDSMQEWMSQVELVEAKTENDAMDQAIIYKEVLREVEANRKESQAKSKIEAAVKVELEVEEETTDDDGEEEEEEEGSSRIIEAETKLIAERMEAEKKRKAQELEIQLLKEEEAFRKQEEMR